MEKLSDADTYVQEQVAEAINIRPLPQDNVEEKSDWEIQRDSSKALGDVAFRKGEYNNAIQHYTFALSLDPEHGALLSNRSAAYLLTSEKSKALHDAEACVKNGSMGLKGVSRLASALQALGRYQQAMDQWKEILKVDPNYAAALKGRNDCASALHNKKQNETMNSSEGNLPDANIESDQHKACDEDDPLDDFFNEVEEVTNQLVKDKDSVGEEKSVATNAIKNHRIDLGTAASQVQRLLPDNYFWHNLNPFRVLDISHRATIEEISRRYKALSLLLHPDKNPGLDRAQEAYDEVLRAKAMLLGGDEGKISHLRALVEQGIVNGTNDWKKQSLGNTTEKNQCTTLEEYQNKAVMKLFAEIEHKRRQVEKNERAHQQREKQQEEEVLQNERNSRIFDKNWQEEKRVDKRVGNWREFQNDTSKKRMK